MALQLNFKLNLKEHMPIRQQICSGGCKCFKSFEEFNQVNTVSSFIWQQQTRDAVYLLMPCLQSVAFIHQAKSGEL